MGGHLQLEKNENTSTSIQKVLVSIYKQLNGDKQVMNTVFKKRESTGQGAYLCVQDARMFKPDGVLELLLFLHLQNPF